MKSALLVGVIALGSLAGSCFAQGQHAAVSAGQPAPAIAHATPARASVAHAAGNHHSATTASAGVARAGNPRPNPRDVDALGAWTMAPRFVGPVSPDGFTNPPGGTNRSHRRSKNAGSSELILFGGGYGYAPDDSQLQGQEQTQDEGQDQADDQQSGGQQQPQYAAAQQVRDRGRQQEGRSDQAQGAESEPAAPLRDVGSFRLVTRGGYQLDAVAFTRSNDRLVYITPDGGRRTIAVRDLDLDSTQRLNQELGTPIEIPSDDAPAASQNSKPAAETAN
jgi:hypothetical protein